MPVDACSLKLPFRRCGTPHANSRFSRPRATSPSASVGTLPCSEVSRAATSWRCSSTRFLMRNMMSVRLLSDDARQLASLLGDAHRGIDLVRRGEVDLPGDLAGGGVVDRPAAPTRPGTRRPPIQCWMRSRSATPARRAARLPVSCPTQYATADRASAGGLTSPRRTSTSARVARRHSRLPPHVPAAGRFGAASRR